MGFKAWLTSSKDEREEWAAARTAKAKASLEAAETRRQAALASARQQFATTDPQTTLTPNEPVKANVRRFNDELEDWKIRNGRLKKGLSKDYDLAGATATLDDSTTLTKRTTGTRVIAGATLAGLATGGLGAIAGGVIGGAAKKKGSKTTLYVTITLNTGDTVIIDTPAKNEKQARKFVGNINGAAQA